MASQQSLVAGCSPFADDLDPKVQDLVLVCAGEEKVPVNSTLLMRATFSPAVNDMICSMKHAHPLASTVAPMILSLNEDQGAAWNVIAKMISHPVAPAQHQGLSWGNVYDVVKLADKYQLYHVLQAVQAYMFAEVAKQPTDARPHITARYDCNEHDVEKLLHLQELLVHAGLHEAMQAVARFHVAYLQSLCTASGSSKSRSSEVYTIIRMLKTGLASYTRNSRDRDSAFQVLCVATNDLAAITEQVAKALLP